MRTIQRVGGRRRFVAGLVGIALAALVPASAPAADGTLAGSIDEGGTITGPTGSIAAGTYDFQVSDTATFHNYHLTGPAVDRATDVVGTGATTWAELVLSDGLYDFRCDVHAGIRGSFRVGAAPTPPPPPSPPPPSPPPPAPPPPAASLPTLRGAVGPGARLTLTNAEGKAVSSAAEGLYTLIVSDRSRTDNFHLSGPGVDRKTGVATTGTATWRLRLKPGVYRARSDAHTSLQRTFRVRR